MGAPIKATVANFKKGAADIVESSQPQLDDVFEFFSSRQFSKGQRAHSVLLRSHLEEFDPVFDPPRWFPAFPKASEHERGIIFHLNRVRNFSPKHLLPFIIAITRYQAPSFFERLPV
jgi:hypothetical protein